jgi:hypothetical protein
MGAQNSKDRLFYQLLCDLSDDIVEDTQSAADKTIDLSTQFLGADSQNLVDDFRTLCASEEIADATEQIKIVQKNMQQVATKNSAIRAEVNVVLGAMQFSEFLRQHLAGICLSFETMINSETSDAGTKSTQQLKLDMQKKMHTFDERKAFHEQVMHEQMPVEDSEITQDLIDQLIG